MSEQVKRFIPYGASSVACVPASDYDALAQRCLSLEVERDGADERCALLLKAKNDWADRARAAEAECDALRTENFRLAVWHSEAGAREDILRAEVERLRHALDRIAMRTEAFVTAGTGASEDSVLVISGIARSALEPTK